MKVRRVSREGNASADTFSAGQIGENRFCMFEQKPEVSVTLCPRSYNRGARRVTLITTANTFNI